MRYYTDKCPIYEVNWPGTLWMRIVHVADANEWLTVGDLRKIEEWTLRRTPNIGKLSCDAILEVTRAGRPSSFDSAPPVGKCKPAPKRVKRRRPLIPMSLETLLNATRTH